jgi:hypothetical protein
MFNFLYFAYLYNISILLFNPEFNKNKIIEDLIFINNNKLFYSQVYTVYGNINVTLHDFYSNNSFLFHYFNKIHAKILVFYLFNLQ